MSQVKAIIPQLSLFFIKLLPSHIGRSCRNYALSLSSTKVSGTRALAQNVLSSYTPRRIQSIIHLLRTQKKTWKLPRIIGKELPGQVKSTCNWLTAFCHNFSRGTLHTSRSSQVGICLALGFLGFRTANGSALCEQVKLSHKSRLSDANLGKQLSASSQPTEPHFNWTLFYKFLRPDLWLFLLASVSAFAVALANIQLPMLLGELVNAISGFTRNGIVQGSEVFEHLRAPVLNLVMNYGTQSLLTFFYISFLSSFGERFAARLRTALFESFISQDISFFDGHRTGELVNRLTADIQDFKSSFKQCISQGLKSGTQIVGFFCTLYAISPKLTGFMAVLLPTVVCLGMVLGSFLRRLSRRAQEQVAKATTVADEAIGNIRTVRAFAMESTESRWFAFEVQQSKYASELLGIGIGVFQGLANLTINGLVLTTMYAGGVLLHSGELTSGDLMSFLVATQTIQKSLAAISVLFGQVVRGLSAGSRVFEYMESHPTIPTQGGEAISSPSFKGSISLQNVTFSYPQRSGQRVLDELSLEIPAGKIVALCAPSGSGKSTIASLIERFYDVDAGRIQIDGEDLKSLDPSWLRGEAIGFINQEPILFATSIMENIRYGKQDATDEEVMAAAKLANADTFIREFPLGYDTVVGERGVTVSGGQKQRIAIARALIKDPRILILDEATSALDAESEKVVQEALDKASEGRTVLIIAHRLSTIRHADKIAVIFKGKIHESGTHEELMGRKGLYAELVRRQMSGLDAEYKD